MTVTARYPSRPGSLWRVTVLSHDGQTVIHHAVCEDLKEVQGVCTEARHASLCNKIWVSPPADGQTYSWD